MYRNGDAGFSTIRAAVGVGVAIVIVIFGLGLMNRVGLDLPNPFDDGHDGDDQAHGQVQVEGQTPQTATDTFVVKIGEGTATVSVKAHQNWDRPGGILSGDVQSTNGTASVRDPDHHDQPAHITVGVDYCAEAQVTRQATTDAPTDDAVTVELGDLYVCDVEWLPTRENEAAFAQDDTPADFQGRFEEVVKGAATAAVAASECPDTLEERYSTDEFLDFLAGGVAERSGVDPSQVTVHPGQAGTTSAETRQDLLVQLEAFTDDEDLDIDAFSGSGTAVEDSCFLDTDGTALSGLDQTAAPDPRAL